MHDLEPQAFILRGVTMAIWTVIALIGILRLEVDATSCLLIGSPFQGLFSKSTIATRSGSGVVVMWLVK